MKNDLASKFFNNKITARDRAIFEAGIKIGAAYHQFIGTPLPKDFEGIRVIEKAIEESLKAQPWVKEAKVTIIANKNKCGEYSYGEVNRRNLYINVLVEYHDIEVEVELKYNKELAYPLAIIKNIKD
ncbi:MAG: dihydroneopterin aldolase family protein [Candidatus Odinarchaeia archaeon]